MKCPETMTTFNPGKRVLLILLTVLLWTHPALAFKSFASGEFDHKTLTPRGLKTVSGTLKAPSPDKTMPLPDSAIIMAQKADGRADSVDSGERTGKALCALMGSIPCAPVLPIIPGLVGAGVETPAGSGPNRSGGKILHVTTLANSGRGSLREAVKARGPRIIVFDVSGYIELESKVKIKHPYLTIAGQTAPFPGISLKGAGITINTHDVLIQHIRIRVGDNPIGPNPGSRDGIAIFGANGEREASYNIVIDHVSVCWALDENISTSYPGVHDISITHSIISEGLSLSIHPEGEHSKGFLVGQKTQNLLILGNLMAHHMDRNIKATINTSTLLVNNLIYNWGNGSSGFGSKSRPGFVEASIVGNVYIRGLDSIVPYPIKVHKKVVAGSRVYVEDIEFDGKTDDPWSVVRLSAQGPKETEVRVDAPPNWIPKLTARKSKVVKNWVLGNAGARRADADPVDLRIIRDVINGSGRIINSQDDIGGWPPLAENARGGGGIPLLSIPSNEIQPSGYTKVEEWLHLLAKQVEMPK